MNRVKNKIALVTGGAEGIGEAVVRLLLDEGAFVIISDIQEQRGTKLAEGLGDQALYLPLDVSQEKDWERVTSLIKSRVGRLDILVNNAGIIGLTSALGPQDPEHTSFKSWHKVHAVNLDGVFLGCKYAIPLMKEAGGSIVNVSSRSGVVGIPGAAAYASSKAAVINHTRTVALYCAEKGYNIRCNVVLPATIMTRIWEPMLGKDPEQQKEAIKELKKTIPLGKMGEPMDVAYGVLYFVSDESKYITGAELVIDGGVLAGSTSSPKPKTEGD